jgi:chaperonin cofactor prefoldin
MAADRARKVSMAQMEESVQVSAGGEERGALFAYQVQHPVSVARGQSAMVPILSSKLPARRELLYNGRKLPTNPVASLRTTNTSGLTLERGPVTVLENGDYAGEAVLPFTREGAELIIPYAVELGIKVSEQNRSDRVTAGVRVQNEYLLIDSYVVSRREYMLTSTLNKAVDVVIEHAPLPGNELYETAEPAEKGAEFMRWSVTCAPNSVTSFVVRERQRTSRREQVRGYNLNALQQFLKNKFLDEQTFAALEGVLALYSQIDQQNRELDKLGKQREKIYQQQKQIQGNLGPLGREGEEGALRGRYVAELNTLEDRLKALATDEEHIRTQIAELEGEVSKKLQELTTRD